MATNLDQLNTLLSTENLGIPDFRRTIDKTGRNLAWVRRAVSNNKNASSEAKRLVSMNMSDLILEYTAPTA